MVTDLYKRRDSNETESWKTEIDGMRNQKWAKLKRAKTALISF
jgi:hypothetical protein